MPEDRTITYPADAAQRVADQLCDWDYNLPGDEAAECAFFIVTDVTRAVDKLRAQEAGGVDAVDVVKRAAARLMEVYGEDGPTGTEEQVDEAIGEALLILGEVTSALGSKET